MISKWLHKVCQAHLTTLSTNLDRAEGELFRLRKAYEQLLAAHQALLLSLEATKQMDGFSRMLSEAWTEPEMAEEAKQFLTPAFEEREGVSG